MNPIKKLKILFFPILKKIQYYINSTENDKVNCIVIICHEGLGDHLAIYNGVLELSKNFTVYICCRKAVFLQIANLLGWPTNVNLIRFFDANKNYHLSRTKRKLLSRYGKLIPLGYYGNHKISIYPDNFYNQLKIDPKISEDKLIPKKINYQYFENINLPDKYVYVNTYHSDKNLKSIVEQFNLPAIVYLSENKIMSYNNGISNIIPTEISNSLCINFQIAKSANFIYSSDGGFYNLLIRSLDKFEMLIETRNHKHQHNPKIYSHKFDGKIHHIIRNNEINLIK